MNKLPETSDNKVLYLLKKINTIITHETDSHKVLRGSAELAAELCHAGQSAVLFPGSQEAQNPFPFSSLLQKSPLLLKSTLEEGNTIRSANLGTDPRFAGETDHSIQSYLAVPVKNRLGHIAGGLFLAHSEPDTFGDAEQEIVETIAQILSVNIESLDTIDQLLKKNEELYSGHAELTESAQKIKAILDTLPQKTWVTDHLGKVIYLNIAWSDYTRQDPALNLDIAWGYFHPEDLEVTAVKYFSSLATKTPFYTESRILSAQGEYRWHILMAKPIQGNSLPPWVCSLADIHDKKVENQTLEEKINERTQALQKANLELERSNFDLMQFASIASHDLKEPLRKVQTYSNLIETRFSNELNDTVKEYLESMTDSIRRMYRLIDDILLYSKTSHAPVEVESVQLGLLLKEIVRDLDISITEKRAEILFDDLCYIKCAKAQMRQVFQNLISNSLKFSFPERPPLIRIRAEAFSGTFTGQDPEKKYCRLVFSDNGIGFDMKYVSKIFTAFQRLQNREAYEGTGIGLAIVKKIIERHNGFIEVESTLGQGSTFTIILPLN